jgi:hypothetical protein
MTDEHTLDGMIRRCALERVPAGRDHAALAAVLENQGLRATSRGGHIALRDAVSAQLDPRWAPACARSIGCADAATLFRQGESGRRTRSIVRAGGPTGRPVH